MPGFEVAGLPPHKSVRGSMWANKEQAKRLIKLRDEADKKLEGLLTGKVRLTLTVHVGIPEWETLDTEARQKALKAKGDLDNFVTGVSDGLMAAHRNLLQAGTWHETFNTERAEIRPPEAIAYEDDSWIFEIRATKVVHPADDWYKIELEELGSE